MAAWRNEIYLRVLRDHVISSISLSMRADFVVCPRVRPIAFCCFCFLFPSFSGLRVYGKDFRQIQKNKVNVHFLVIVIVGYF